MRKKLKIAALFIAVFAGAFFLPGAGSAAHQAKQDRSAWGSNHVGKPVPEFVSGDECLFCHRSDIGPNWQKNSHGITIRQGESAPRLNDALKTRPAISKIAGQVEYFLGSRNHARLLKKDGYGKFAILDTQARLGKGGDVEG